MKTIVIEHFENGKCFNIIQPKLFETVRSLDICEVVSVEVKGLDYSVFATAIKTSENTLYIISYGKLIVFPNDTILIDF